MKQGLTHLDALGVGHKHSADWRHAGHEQDAKGEVDVPEKHAQRVEQA